MKRRTVVLSIGERTSYRRLEDVIGCKWSVAVLSAINQGITRPGRIERFIPGISTKVLNERFRRLVDFGLITRSEIPGRIQHVEYALTDTGRRLAVLIAQIRDLDAAHAGRGTPRMPETPPGRVNQAAAPRSGAARGA